MKRAAISLALILSACTQDAPVDENEDPGWGSTPAGSSSRAGGGGSSGGLLGGSSSTTAATGSSTGTQASSTPGNATSTAVGTSSSTGGGNTEPSAFVWGHSAGSLYVLDADSLVVTVVGPFLFHDQSGAVINDDMTDIAVDSNGNLYGCSYSRLFTIDPVTAEANMVASLGDSYNGLTFIPAGMIESDEILVGASNTGGTLYKID